MDAYVVGPLILGATSGIAAWQLIGTAYGVGLLPLMVIGAGLAGLAYTVADGPSSAGR